MTARTGFVTHEVLNQPPPLENFNLYTTDHALMKAKTDEILTLMSE